jgi:Immunity protein Imm1
MLKFKYTKVAGQRTLSLTPQKVSGMLRAMQKRATWEGVIISPDAKPGPDGEGQYPVLSLGWYPGFGYEAHCMELSPKSHFVATSKKLSKPEVYVDLGGQGQELWPRELFVPLLVAEQVVLHLLRTGKRQPSLPWVAINAFPRQNVRARKRT